MNLTSQAKGFADAARQVIGFLHRTLGFDLWMVTRTEGNNWIVLQTEDHGYGVTPNSVFAWSDSFCSRMMEGQGPRIAPRSDSIPAYLAAPIGQQVKIGAYVGVPLTYEDGSLFGTLCAIHPTPKEQSLTEHLPLLELFASMLSSLLNAEIRATDGFRQAERARSDAEQDALTGLYNRRGWDRLVEAEEQRCKAYGHPACAIVIDLDGLKIVNDIEGHAAGDELIRRAAQAIRTAVRDSDIVARVGGDEFLVLGVECSLAKTESLLRRIEAELKLARVKASVGHAMRMPAFGIGHAVEQADTIMYRCKFSKR